MNESDLERRVADVLRKRSEDAMRDVHVEEDLDTLRRRAKREARSRRTLGVAAALVMLVAGAALLLPERGSSAPDSADAAAPSASADATPTAAPGGTAAVATPAAPRRMATGELIRHRDGVLSLFGPEGQLQLHLARWLVACRHGQRTRGKRRGGLGGPVGNVYVDGCRGTPQDPPLGPTVDDLANVWGKLPGFTATTPVDITVDGYAGKRVDFTLPPYDKTECVYRRVPPVDRPH